MSTQLSIGSVIGSEGAQNFAGVFHGPVTVGTRDDSKRRSTYVVVCFPDQSLTRDYTRQR
jgi:hypothetical protein